MRNWILKGSLALLFLEGAGFAQPMPSNTGPAAELASLHEDVRLLQQRVGELSMTVEQLNRDNSALQAKAGQNFVTIEELNKAVAEINRTMHDAVSEQKRDVLQQVGAQIERLAKQTQAAIDAVARNEATRPAIQTTFTDNYPKEGISYTVQPGDVLAIIARKNNAKVQDIINANKITDPSKIRVGQTLFIPQGK